MFRVLRLFAVLLVLPLVVGGAAGVWLYADLQRPFQGYDRPERFVEIPPGAGADTIADRLIAAGVVRDRWSFRLALWQSGAGRHLQAGEYRFAGPLTARQVVDKLARGEVYLWLITFPEGLTIVEMARIFEAGGFGPASAFLDASRDTSRIAALDPDAPDLEGYLYPDTYALPRRTSAATLVARMVARFEEALDESLRRDASARGLTVRQAVTLASLVEEETARPDERPLVSAVYHNRLRRRMGLQCDPTVIYALQRAGRYDGNLRREDLAFDSPYNTYRYAGLPPGPIAAPGRASLEAAVRPAPVDYLYFVSRNDGSHVFAGTLAEHNRNVREYQVQYFRAQRLRERQRPRASTGGGSRR